uniref:Uncharacterized protein n=1 Tax=Timema bartmani TaxID=61472 RepID=A0A7R9I5Q9_9NEOP|nr:unnamed protein product [Timema bartmani]
MFVFNHERLLVNRAGATPAGGASFMMTSALWGSQGSDYMIKRMNMTVKQAIEAFQEARGHEVERAYYIADLQKLAQESDFLTKLNEDSINRPAPEKSNLGQAEIGTSLPRKHRKRKTKGGTGQHQGSVTGPKTGYPRNGFHNGVRNNFQEGARNNFQNETIIFNRPGMYQRPQTASTNTEHHCPNKGIKFLVGCILKRFGATLEGVEVPITKGVDEIQQGSLCMNGDQAIESKDHGYSFNTLCLYPGNTPRH